jgi:iron complex outermembrane receptor protein
MFGIRFTHVAAQSTASFSRSTALRLASLVALSISAPSASAAQGTTRPVVLSVRVEAGSAPLAEAQVRAGAQMAISNSVGIAQLRLPAGPATIRASRIGFAPDSLRLVLAEGRDTLVTIALVDLVPTMTTVVVSSARGASRIEDAPLRVEALAGEDVAEKMELRPADVTTLLNEMGGVRIQRTSAASGAAGVRLQGLRPRYTLLLTDGLPLSGASGSGLDLLQLPPADLRQVEVIKGPATALYGPAALGGMINLVSKRPTYERDVLVQQSSEGGTNAYGWISERFSPSWGVTALLGGHKQTLRDINGDNWADMPGLSRIEVRPRLFVDGANGSGLLVTAGGTAETRDGGFLPGTSAPDGTSYSERYRTTRGDIGAVGHRFAGGTLLQARSAITGEVQEKKYGAEDERTSRSSAFAELSASRTIGPHDLLAGAALQTDHNAVREASALDYSWNTVAAFAQDVWRIAPRVAVTGSARIDQHSRFGSLFGPRLSVLYTLRPGITARASWASGQSVPTPYVEESHEVGVRRVTDFASLQPERAEYLSADITGTTGPFELNATVFDTRVRHAVQADVVGARVSLRNAIASVRARGAELFARVIIDEFYATALYSYTDASEPDVASSAGTEAPYMPKHAGGVDLTLELEDIGAWIALEGFYTGAQRTSNDPYTDRAPPYTVVGLLLAKQLGQFRIFCSMENLTNVRQADRYPLVRPLRTSDGRWTTAPWGQMEGRVISIGVRWSGQGTPHGLLLSK